MTSPYLVPGFYEDALAKGRHRDIVGGRWDETGRIQMHILQEAGLITRRIDGTKRPCRLAPDGLEQIEAWANMMRRTYAANYDRLDQVLANLPKGDAT